MSAIFSSLLFQEQAAYELGRTVGFLFGFIFMMAIGIVVIKKIAKKKQ